jgi:AcrR family transcriptional regulator
MAGRPRKLSDEQILDRAIEVLRERGFEGTSLSHLTEAVKLGPSSLYARFGSKEGLYEAAIQRYQEQSGTWLRDALQLPDARAALPAVLRGAAERYAAPSLCERGCAVLSSGRLSTDCTDASLVERRQGMRGALVQRVQQGVSDGQLLADTPVEAVADWVLATLHGLSAMARDGVPPQRLGDAVELALPSLSAWFAEG